LDQNLAVPLEPQPAQVLQNGVDVFAAAAVGVDVLDAEEEAAAGVAGAAPGLPGGVSVAEMEMAGGAKRVVMADMGMVALYLIALIQTRARPKALTLVFTRLAALSATPSR
jgi:hypothetical protein